MSEQTVRITVYGAEVKCASCVNAPGAKETFEWLQAAITRKFGTTGLHYQYYDIHSESQDGADVAVIQQILDDERFYPLVLIEDEIVGEGDPKLKKIYQVLKSHGLQEVNHS